MSKIIFLDFDGVLHPDAVYRPRNKPLELRAPGALFMHAHILEQHLDAAGDVDIILSTSWVRMLGFERTLKKMPEGLRKRVTGATWHKGMRNGDRGMYSSGGDPFSFWTRFQQIDAYVRRHDVQDWIAIDDLHSGEEAWPEQHRHRLVLTDPNEGLGSLQAQAGLIEKLKGI